MTQTRVDNVSKIPLASLKEDPLFRNEYEDIIGEEWTEFVQSIRDNNGCELAIRVSKNGQGYDIWDGYQRVRAYREIGIDEITCVILPGGWRLWDDDKKLKWLERYNKHRRHTAPSKKAAKYKKIKEKSGIQHGGDREIDVKPEENEQVDIDVHLPPPLRRSAGTHTGRCGQASRIHERQSCGPRRKDS